MRMKCAAIIPLSRCQKRTLDPEQSPNPCQGASGYDAIDSKGRKIQIETRYAAKQIGFRGDADLMLVFGVSDDGSWEEIYFADFETVKGQSRHSARDSKQMIAITKLRKI